MKRTIACFFVILAMLIAKGITFGATPHLDAWDSGTSLLGWGKSTSSDDYNVIVQQTGGNPGGYLYTQDTNTNPPGGYLGIVPEAGVMTSKPELSGDYGFVQEVRISVDLKFEYAMTSTKAYLRLRYSASTNAWRYLLVTNPPVGSWQTYTVTIDPNWTDAQAVAAGWVSEGSGTPSFAETLAHVYTTEIRFSEGLFIAGIDNFSLTDYLAIAGVWFVDGTLGNDTNSGWNWAYAKRTIRAAIDSANPGDEIWVKGGIYTILPGTRESPSEILVDRVVEIYGGFTGTETLREQRDWKNNTTTVKGLDYETRCFHISAGAAGATIDGFTITGGRISSDNIGPLEGGGILVESNDVTIKNCLITDNRASVSGGGVAFAVDADGGYLLNTRVSNNTSGFGVGGVLLASRAYKVVNCVIDHNQGENVGGISSPSLASAPDITNCVIAGNNCEGTSSQASGLYCRGTATLINSIIWGNFYNEGGVDQINTGAGSAISHCDVEQIGFEGQNANISEDPLFADGSFHLAAGSPCIDAGDNNAPGLGTVNFVDFEGEPRIVGASVDMGAYEYQLQVTYCSDLDSDGYVVVSGGCTIPAGKQAGDCNDNNAAIHPGATEVPNNGVDEDCSGSDLDTIGPDIQMTLPGDGMTAGLDTNIVMHVTDGSSGVVKGTIVMKVGGVTVTPVISPSSSPSSDYTLTYDPPANFTNGQLVNVVVTASDMAGNSQTESFSFTAVSGSQLDPLGDEDLDGIPNGVEATLGTDPLKKTLFVRPYKKTSTGLAYWSDFSAVLFSDPRGTGFARILPFDGRGIEISVIGDSNHPYAQMRNINYDPAADSSHPACDILELIYNETGSETDLPTDSVNKGHTYFDGQTWTWDTKGKTPNISLNSYYLKYKYHKPYAYALPLDRYIAEGAYMKVDLNEQYIGTSGCGCTYCYECNHCSPMNLNDGETAPPYDSPPDGTVEMTPMVYDASNGLKAKITAIGTRGQGYNRNAVLKRTIVHEMGHAILGASNGDHCNEPNCILYHSTVGGWELLNFGGQACTHGQSIPGGIHNTVH